MVEIRRIDAARRDDLNLPNQPFPLIGRLRPSYANGRWDYDVERFDAGEMRFPDEGYDYDALSKDGAILGAYDGGRCVGLAILQRGFFKYMYLSDLKVNADRRRAGIGAKLVNKAKDVATDAGFRGIYTIGQDDNLAACLFYLKCGFRIGGLDTEVYRGTAQADKADIFFYLDC